MQNQEHNSQRVHEERTAADVAAYKTLTKEQLVRWELCRSTHRFMAYDMKEIVAYRLVNGAPEVLSILTNAGVSVTQDGGLQSTWFNKENERFDLNHQPQEVAPGCFMWHPKHNSLELVDWKGGKSLRFSTMWRTACNPAKKVAGKVYLCEKHAFVRNS